MSDLLPNSIRKKILAQITPTKDEVQKQKEIISHLTRALIETAESLNYDYSFIEPQGSTGKKQTQLRGAADIDLFVGINPLHHQEILKKPTEEKHHAINIMMNSLVEDWFIPAVSQLKVERLQKAYSQHPFLSMRMGGMEIDILGCFDIDADTLATKGPITAVDRTVHHSRFVFNHLTKKKREDSRILKSFVRACHAYGDTCAVGRMGLTGVALEFLVIATTHLNEALSRLEHLDISPFDPKHRTLEQLRKIPTFRDDHILLIDPTDHNRNVAASFTPRAYSWVQYQARSLREALSRGEFESVLNEFIESPIPVDDLPNWLKSHCFSYEFKSDGKTHYTIIRDKMHRMAKKLQNELATERTGELRFGDSLTEIIFERDNYALGLIVECPQISKAYLRQGPPVHLKKPAEEFRKSHQKVFEEDEYLYVEEDREWTDARVLIERFITGNQIEGISRTIESSTLSKQVLNVLSKYVLLIEPEFSSKITRVKHTK